MKDILISENAYLVHCSSYAPMVQTYEGDPKGHLEKLSYATDPKEPLSICCSTLKPGDAYNANQQNITGTIGILVCPNSIVDVIAAASTDDGSHGEEEKNKDISESIILEAIKERPATEHNEIRISSYQVYGIILCDDVVFSTREEPFTTRFSDEAIYQQFGAVKYYRWTGGLMFKIPYDEDLKKFHHPSKEDYVSAKVVYS